MFSNTASAVCYYILNINLGIVLCNGRLLKYQIRVSVVNCGSSA